ncbi:MAG: alcohol dehydrogenase catalytic domain-containing protein [Candidatus Bathyarchaeia archaeon]
MIEVRSGAICGTDIHLYNWDLTGANFPVRFPLILGHEFSGDVVEIGPNVEGFSVGDRVAVETHIPCGTCYQCGLGEGHNCQNMELIGITYPGAFATYAKAPAKVTFKLPPTVSHEEGSLFEPAGVAMRGIDEAKISPGDLVVIIGCGPIGLIAIQIAWVVGASQVIAIDLNDFRLQMARHFGAFGLNPLRDNVVQKVKEIAGRKGGADVILEISGAPAVYEYLFELLRMEGKLVTIGHATKPISINISKQINIKGATIKGIFGRRIWETWEHLASLVMAKRIDLSGVITHRFPIEKYEEAFKQVHGNAGKVLFKP